LLLPVLMMVITEESRARRREVEKISTTSKLIKRMMRKLTRSLTNLTMMALTT